eukprot:656515-Prorocentrum_minimum.AAC.4
MRARLLKRTLERERAPAGDIQTSTLFNTGRGEPRRDMGGYPSLPVDVDQYRANPTRGRTSILARRSACGTRSVSHKIARRVRRLARRSTRLAWNSSSFISMCSMRFMVSRS